MNAPVWGCAYFSIQKQIWRRTRHVPAAGRTKLASSPARDPRAGTTKGSQKASANQAVRRSAKASAMTSRTNKGELLAPEVRNRHNTGKGKFAAKEMTKAMTPIQMR